MCSWWEMKWSVELSASVGTEIRVGFGSLIRPVSFWVDERGHADKALVAQKKVQVRKLTLVFELMLISTMY